MPRSQESGSNVALDVPPAWPLHAITNTALPPDLYTHLISNYLNNPRDANSTYLPPRFPPHPPSSGAKPLCSQPPPLNLPREIPHEHRAARVLLIRKPYLFYPAV
ncbi:hypothetical protein BDZ45DRAFT_743392 [Acephala macrosclerotiorum]|nr:hypothetical protein BDZ45DRAFT_743392 [Acephala macrosclerotiorum]